ncbi:hypothetical protein OC846_001204 [Tilletia horrida]|uniref:Uncharacterized protein n=1 Tax=Tilletia horrida TaxID=155126 RepID=A0AAN6GT36_9BASI|nr:hypothetical protein OC845_000234 [Tilletia horrida]KAK0556381.1 hypothetical protein OC846_001204 [Tilletia horrida]KAK0569281.1 hypothetical protein OC861_001096 [Tilletia horrida]
MAALNYGGSATADVDYDDAPTVAPADGGLAGAGPTRTDDDDDEEEDYQEFDAEAAMQGIVNNPDISLDELYEAQEQGNNAGRPSTRFYEYPAQESIAAGQRRGIQSIGHLNPAALEPAFPEEFLPADQQPQADDPSFLVPPEPSYSFSSGLPNLRLSALHIAGIPITQLSTSRLFAYVTQFGAQPLGLEWIDDERAVIVFAEPEAARLAFEYLCPPGAGRFRKKRKVEQQDAKDSGKGQDADAIEVDAPDGDDEDVPLHEEEGTGVLTSAELSDLIERMSAMSGIAAEPDPANVEPGSSSSSPLDPSILRRVLMPRQAHRIPLSLYTIAEREGLAQIQQSSPSEGENSTLTMLDAEGNRVPIPADAPAIYREMAEQEQRAALLSPEMTKLLALRGRLHVRFALEGKPDIKQRGARQRSKWFSDHGWDAGREVVPKLLAVGLPGEEAAVVKGELFPDRAAPPSLARSDARRSGGDRDGNGSIRGRGRGAGRAVMDDLDAELENYSAQRNANESNRSRPELDETRADLVRPADRWVNDRADEGAYGEAPSLFDRLSSGRARRGYSRDRSPEGFSGIRKDDLGREQRRARDYNKSSAGVKGRGSVRGALAWGDDEAAGQDGEVETQEDVDHRTLQARMTTLDERIGSRSLLDRFGPDSNGG